MTKKKADEWGSAPRTLEVLREVNGRDIHARYLHMLWKQGRLEKRPIDGRTYEYNLTQARGITITEKRGAGRRPTKAEDTKKPA